MNAREKAEVVHREHPEWGRQRLSAAAGCTRAVAEAVLKGAPSREIVEPSVARQRGISVKDFIRSIDYPAQVREGIAKHLRTTFMREDDFRAILGMRADRFRRAVDRQEFAANKWKKDGYTYWSIAENVRQAKSKDEETI